MLLGQRVAVKVLRRHYADDPARLSRFLAAARQAAAVSHPSVATVRDYGNGGPDNAPYLVTEFIEGPSLAEVISGEAVRPSLIAATLAQVAEGLHAAHQAGLAHGDLKPANILLAGGGGRRAMVTDFAITHALDAIARAGHTPGTVHGTATVLYLAPERVSGGLGTPAGDLYSLGIIAHEWLAGTPPFTGTAQQVLAAHLRRPLPRLPVVVPPGLARLVARLADKDPGNRFPDAREVARAARALAGELREGAQGDPARFPVRLEIAPDFAATRQQATIAAPRPADEAAGLRLSGLRAHKREIAWAASALVLAGLIGWAPSAPIGSAVKVVQLAIPAAGHQAGPAGHRDTAHRDTARHPGSAGGQQAAGLGGSLGPGGSGASPAGQPPGHGPSGQGGGPMLAGGAAGTAGVVASPRSASPVPAAAGGSSRPSASPCPCGPASPLASPTMPASPTLPASPASQPAPGRGPQPPSDPASRPAPTPPIPLPIPVISVSVPPLTVPAASVPPLIVPGG